MYRVHQTQSSALQLVHLLSENIIEVHTPIEALLTRLARDILSLSKPSAHVVVAPLQLERPCHHSPRFLSFLFAYLGIEIDVQKAVQPTNSYLLAVRAASDVVH